MAKTPVPIEDERHLSPQELAAREGVALMTVYQWNSRGGGPPFIKTGRLVRYRLNDVLAWEKARLVVSGEPA
jgi:excisionase family DNA binding protein